MTQDAPRKNHDRGPDAAAGTRVLVAMSGGVDSSVAAALLKEAGHEVIGAFMRNGVKASAERAHRQGCCGVEDALDARRVADRLEIPFYALDYADAFEGLIGDFVDAYAKGRTPNPCIECNSRFKMGSLRHLAHKVGATAVATGHYARIERLGDRFSVAQGRDVDKDQSYVLFGLDQDALSHTLLPLGHLTKGEVREHARRLALPVAEKPESMEICFVPSGDYRDVLRERAPEVFDAGRIVHTDGRDLGEHEGTASFTIGQRRGLPGGQPEPLYVTDLDPATKTVTVGGRDDLLGERFTVSDVTFSGLSPQPAGATVRGDVKIRSHHVPVPGTITFDGDGGFEVALDRPEAAITPGQAAVVYRDGAIQFGGWIVESGTPV